MPDRAPAASSVQETIVVSKMRGNLVIFNQDNFMNHETLIIKKDKETLLLSGAFHHLMDNDAYFAEDIPDYVSAHVPIALVEKWRSILWTLQDHIVKRYHLEEGDCDGRTELTLKAPALGYWDESDGDAPGTGKLPLKSALNAEMFLCDVRANNLSSFDTQLHLNSDGELVVYGAKNTLVSWSFTLGFVEDLMAIAEGSEGTSSTYCHSGDVKRIA